MTHVVAGAPEEGTRTREWASLSLVSKLTFLNNGFS